MQIKKRVTHVSNSLIFEVVPPGIEPFALVYSNSLIDSIFLLYIL